jgi:hypothetical protein
MSGCGDEIIRVPFDQIQSVRMILGDRCRVESFTDREGRTLTITTENGTICVFKGHMKFTWVLPPESAK